MRTLGILDLWRSNIYRKIQVKRLKERADIIKQDRHEQFLSQKRNEIEQYLEDNKLRIDFSIPEQLTDETAKALLKLSEKITKEQLALDDKYDEIKTMISACDTYEQEMDVLKAYGIVDENGVLIKEQLEEN